MIKSQPIMIPDSGVWWPLVMLPLLQLLLICHDGGEMVHAQALPRYPAARYTAWDKVGSSQQTNASSQLGYNKALWDLPGTNPVENLAWDSLSTKQKSGAPDLDCGNDKCWDCWINHYTDYDWSELEAFQVTGWKTLGWTENGWNTNESPPSEDLEWKQLSTTQRAAATSLCYFEETWDEELKIPDWKRDNTDSDDNDDDSASGLGTSLAALLLLCLQG